MGLIRDVGKIRHFTLPLDDARDREKMLQFRGHYLSVLRTSQHADAEIYLNDTEGDAYPMIHGLKAKHYPITCAYMSNAAQPGEWVEVLVWGSPDDADLSRLEVNIMTLADTATQSLRYMQTLRMGGIYPYFIQIKGSVTGTTRAQFVDTVFGNPFSLSQVEFVVWEAFIWAPANGCRLEFDDADGTDLEYYECSGIRTLENIIIPGKVWIKSLAAGETSKAVINGYIRPVQTDSVNPVA